MKSEAMIATFLAKKDHSGELRADCPVCGYHDAFVMRVKHSSPVSVYCFNHCSRQELREAVSIIAGKVWKQPTQPDPIDLEQAAARTAKANNFWDSCAPLAGSPGEIYLAMRGVEHLASSNALRFHPAAPHPGGLRRPALVAQVVDVEGKPIGVHRTYLTSDGHVKAAANPQRASLGRVEGGVSRLFDINPALPLVVGEGIETSASAGLMLNGMPAWAAISAGNLEKSLNLPSEIHEVVIAVDPDPPGIRAANKAGNRWKQEGRSVKFACPDGSGDFNDLICAMQQETAHG